MLILVVLGLDGGWWKGTLVHNNTYGSFPSNFVERMYDTCALDCLVALVDVRIAKRWVLTLSFLSVCPNRSPSDSNKDAKEGTLSPIRPLSRQQHTRQSSTENRFAKRKPVNTEDGKRATMPITPTTKSPHPESNNASNVSVSNGNNPPLLSSHPSREKGKKPHNGHWNGFSHCVRSFRFSLAGSCNNYGH